MACRLVSPKPLSEPMLEYYIVNWTLWNKLRWNLNRNSYFSFKKMHLQMSSGKFWPFCPSLNVLTHWNLGAVVMILTHWGRVTHICVCKLAIICSNNGLSPGRRQVIIWTNVGILSIGPMVTNFSKILIGIQIFSLKKMHVRFTGISCEIALRWML